MAIGGRPRDAGIDIALRKVIFDMLAESAPHEVSLRSLTTRAGVTRDAFYRRYPSIGHFYVDLAAEKYPSDPTVDTGSLHEDLLVIQREQAAMCNGLLEQHLLPQLLGAMASDPSSAAAFAEWFLAPRRATYLRVFQRAVERAEIPPVQDPQYVLDLLSGAIFLRAAIPGIGVIDDEFVRQTVASAERELTAGGLSGP